MKRKPPPARVHASMPDGSEPVCTHYDAGTTYALTEPRRTSLELVTCRACLTELRKRPGLVNHLAAARSPVLPFERSAAGH